MYKIIAVSVAALLSACSYGGGSVGTVSTDQVAFYQKEQCLTGSNGRYCANATVVLPQTGIDWLDKALRQRLYALHSVEGQPAVQSDEDLKKHYVDSVNEFAANLKDYASENSAINELSNNLNVDLVAQRGKLATFNASSFSYTGGAHGNHSVNYIVADLEKQKLLTIQDVVLETKLGELDRLVQQEYDNFISMHTENPQEAADYKASFSEKAGVDDFMLTAEGIDFYYSPYQIAPYSEGVVKLSVAKNELKNIIKPEYLDSLKAEK